MELLRKRIALYKEKEFHCLVKPKNRAREYARRLIILFGTAKEWNIQCNENQTNSYSDDRITKNLLSFNSGYIFSISHFTKLWNYIFSKTWSLNYNIQNNITIPNQELFYLHMSMASWICWSLYISYTCNTTESKNVDTKSLSNQYRTIPRSLIFSLFWK